jgi:hypothetical protein
LEQAFLGLAVEALQRAPIGGGGNSTAIVVIEFTCDQAIPNINLMQHVNAAVKKINVTAKAAGLKHIVLAAHSLCMSHQLSLAACSQYAFGGRAFMGGLSGVCHIFATGSYFCRIWSAAITRIAGIKVCRLMCGGVCLHTGSQWQHTS